MQNCSSFLSQLEVYDANIGLVSKTNTQQHRCILFPVLNFMSSTLILKISTLLDCPNLCQLADLETPTTNIGIPGQDAAIHDDESEDYNDISSMSLCFKKIN